MSYESFVIVFARAFGFTTLLPLDRIGGGGYTFRITLACLLSFIITPNIDHSFQFSSVLLIQEFLTGALIAVPAMLLIECGSMWGEIFDTGRGQTIGSVLDPSSGINHSQTALLGREVCIVWLFLSGAFESLIFALTKSIQESPPTTWSVQTYQSIGMNLMNCINASITGVFGALIPFVFLFMTIEVGASFIGKVTPVSLQSETFITKTSLGALSVVALISFGGIEALPAALQRFNFP